MDETAKTPEAHVVAAKAPDAHASSLGPALYAVIADTPEEARAAVLEVTPPDTIVESAGGPLMPETAGRLELVPGEAKQIG